MKNKLIQFCVLAILFLVVISSVSAGVGIKMGVSSLLVGEGEEGCVEVGAYNPFSSGTNILIGVSEELKEVLTLQEAETKYLPPETSSSNAIPMKFCFKVPGDVYERDYKISGRFIDKLDCDEEQKVYEGEVILSSVSSSSDSGGIGGSATQMSVSQPLRVRVSCNPYPWDYTLLYIFIAALSVSVVSFVLFRKYRKPKAERIREKMKKLKEEMKKSKK